MVYIKPVDQIDKSLLRKIISVGFQEESLIEVSALHRYARNILEVWLLVLILISALRFSQGSQLRAGLQRHKWKFYGYPWHRVGFQQLLDVRECRNNRCQIGCMSPKIGRVPLNSIPRRPLSSNCRPLCGPERYSGMSFSTYCLFWVLFQIKNHKSGRPNIVGVERQIY